MVAACDTFRAGAVEQLKTHCTRLGIPLYERGYEKDPAKVAFEAIKAAERAKCDVLLVDTAGARPWGWLFSLSFPPKSPAGIGLSVEPYPLHAVMRLPFLLMAERWQGGLDPSP